MHLSGCFMARCVRMPVVKPDSFWKRQQYLRMAWKFSGRKRHCYTLMTRQVHRALMFSYRYRKLRKIQMRALWNMRIRAAVTEHGLADEHQFLEALARLNIQLDRKVLNDLAIYEPRSFQSLAELAKEKAVQDGINGLYPNLPPGVVPRAMLNEKLNLGKKDPVR